jgi:hypothetical protein
MKPETESSARRVRPLRVLRPGPREEHGPQEGQRTWSRTDNKEYTSYTSFSSSLSPPNLSHRRKGFSCLPSPATPKLPKVAMTRSEAAEGGAAPETKGDVIGATAASSLHSNLGAAGGASPATSAERVDFKVSPSRYNVFLVMDLSRDWRFRTLFSWIGTAGWQACHRECVGRRCRSSRRSITQWLRWMAPRRRSSTTFAEVGTAPNFDAQG